MNDRQAIDAHHRAKRLASATTDDEKKLADVEIAVIASRQALIDEEQTMRDDDKYSDAYIVAHMTKRKEHSKAYIAKLAAIVDPIARRVESKAKATEFQIPTRSAIHIEASAHYNALDSDRRQEAISRAIVGKDNVLAVALLTAPGDPITDITRDLLIKRLAPQDNREKILDTAKRVQATLATIEGEET